MLKFLYGTEIDSAPGFEVRLLSITPYHIAVLLFNNPLILQLEREVTVSNNTSISEKKEQSDYHQVTNIRFLSMITIVAMHTQIFQLSFINNPLNICLFQFIKFGTIGFFLISGFLLGTKLTDVDPWVYFRRRLRSTFRPWLFWAGIFSIIALINQSFWKNITLKDVAGQIYTTAFLSNYWFVINFLFALGILLIFRKFFQNRIFSGILLLCSLFYGINLYFRWIPSNHTTAIAGYIFYIWLGIQISIHKNQLTSFFDSVRWHWFFLAVMGSFLLSIGEAKLLADTCPDYLSSLRISNQVYSLVVFFALFKIGKPISPSWMNVRNQTYGIYLIHWLILDVFKSFVSKAGAYYYHISGTEFLDQGFKYLGSPVFTVVFWIFAFLIVYLSSWYVTRIISQSRVSGIVGIFKHVIHPHKSSV